MAQLSIKVEIDEEKFQEMIEEFKGNNPDFVEVVRCKDCKYFVESAVSKLIFCNRHNLIRIKPDDFCSFGKKKENN